MRFVTTVWAIGYIAEALLRVAMALSLRPALVVTASPILAFGVTIALITWSRRYMLAFRQRRIRERQTDAS